MLAGLTEDERASFDERAGVLEFDGGHARGCAERIAFWGVVDARREETA